MRVPEDATRAGSAPGLARPIVGSYRRAMSEPARSARALQDPRPGAHFVRFTVASLRTGRRLPSQTFQRPAAHGLARAQADISRLDVTRPFVSSRGDGRLRVNSTLRPPYLRGRGANGCGGWLWPGLATLSPPSSARCRVSWSISTLAKGGTIPTRSSLVPTSS